MAQNNDISRNFTRFTRVDFVALRYHLSGIDAAAIASPLYDEGTLLDRGTQTPAGLSKWLDDLKRHLVSLAVVQNPGIAQIFAQINKSGRWYKAAMQHLIEIGEKTTLTRFFRIRLRNGSKSVSR